ncbi:MAG: hypothetical protein NT096_10865 [Proteobacteria bacterium]|nr:hypothetical protein [Pseudomonadota bacterium]
MTVSHAEYRQSTELDSPNSKMYFRLLTVFIISLMLAGIFGFIVITAKVWNFTVDDSYITFRYAENLAKGWGPTFNKLPPRAEGYSSILWTVIMAIPHIIVFSPVIFSKVLGLIFTIATLMITSVTVYSAERDTPSSARITGAIVAPLLFLSFPFCAIHAVSGMETALATLLYAIVVALFIPAKDISASRWLFSLCCLLLGLTRPEANLFCIILIGLTLVSLPRQRWMNFIIGCFALYIIPGVIYFAWRWHYYGILFPLPFYIKSAAFGLRGLHRAYSFFENIAVGFTLPVLLAIAFRPVKALTLILPILAMCGYFLTINHEMGYGDRYFYPLLPALSVLAGMGVVLLMANLKPRLHLKKILVIIPFIALALALGFARGYFSANNYSSYAYGLMRAHVLLGRTLAAAAWQTSDPILAIYDAGAVPYISRLTTIDSFGLNDPFIATHFLHDRSDYVLSKKPTLVVFVSKRPDSFDPLFYYVGTSLYESFIKSGYTHKATFPFSKRYYLWAMWHPDSKDGPMLDRVLGDASRHSHAMLKLYPIILPLK